MYASFFGLRDRPFDLTPNPRYLFLTARHREAIAAVQYAIDSRRGMALLVGEAGTGKTTVLHAALHRGDRSGIVYVNNPTLSRSEFVEYLARAFGLSAEARGSKAAFLFELGRALEARAAAGSLSALVVDEAQTLSVDLLEEIRLLANIETATTKLLPVILAGQPELTDRLNGPELRQLKQRVAVRAVLTALSRDETAAYVQGRLRIAGARGPGLFTADALAEIHERARGIPRTISVIADNALISAFAAGVRIVDRGAIVDVCGDFELPSTTAGPTALSHVPRPPARLA
jgi:general secretion pathway protein A